MPSPPVGREGSHARRNSVLRGLGFSLAVILGAVAVWLIATSTTSPKRIEIGVLLGLWGLLLGAFSVFGTRHPSRAEAGAAAGQELAARGGSELERADDAAARRHFEARLEHMLRRELQASMSREMSALRDEVSSLRTELLDKVGGQLRLERIETTRVIGSDIEAIKREVNQLKGARLFGEPGHSSAPVTRITSSHVLETQSHSVQSVQSVQTAQSSQSSQSSSGSDRLASTVRPFVQARILPPEPPEHPEPHESPVQRGLDVDRGPDVEDAVVIDEPASAEVPARPGREPAPPTMAEPPVPPVPPVQAQPAKPEPFVQPAPFLPPAQATPPAPSRAAPVEPAEPAAPAAPAASAEP
ncbi:MAG: DUF6779 domain-containing protein, partial [Jatrophihabitantaceae bacterium]